nr:MAG TPA: Major head protein [Caudoviricetes sp.]
MTDGKENIDDTGTGGEPQPELKTFTQDEVDKIVSQRLKAERERRDREDKTRADEAAEQARIAQLEGEERVKAEYEQKVKARDTELAELKRTLAVTRAQGELAKQGLPVEFAGNLIGDSDDQTDANIAAFSKSVSDLVARQVSESLNRGTPPAGQGAGPTKEDEMSSMLDRLMGIKR